MKFAFFSNYLSHHQKPFCDAMQALCGEDFSFVASKTINEKRLKMGWRPETAPYLIPAYLSGEAERRALALAAEADVVLLGSAPDRYLTRRLSEGKLTFRYSERLYKDGLSWKQQPRAMASAWLHHGRFQRKPVYMLCASAYTAGDCARFGNYVGRTYRWGYFPAVPRYSDLDGLLDRKDRTTILWAGRFLPLKHPDDCVETARRLKSVGLPFSMELIGTGELEPELRRRVSEAGLEARVRFLGAMPPEAVRSHMERAGIYLFTSGRQEGWGAVLNEAMSSACAVVASDAAGSTPFLVKDGDNGCIYHGTDRDALYGAVRALLEEPERQTRLGRGAYGTMTGLWNPETAARRILELSRAILDGDPAPALFTDGPCSPAPQIREDWYIQ